MSVEFTLDSLREEMDRQYAPVKITLSDGSVAVLRNLLRMPKGDRKRVVEVLDELSKAKGDDEITDDTKLEEVLHLEEYVMKVLEVVPGDDKGKKLVDELGGDVLMGLKIIERWQESTQPGEAESSPAS